MLYPKGSTTTTTEAPVGKNRTFEFTSSVPGLEVKISFVQLEGNTLEMHCDVKTDPSATETLDRFCSMDTRPKIYLIEDYEDCSTLPSDGFVNGQMIAELDKPSKFFHTIRDRSSTCALRGFFWLLSHVIYLKLTRELQECLLSQASIFE